ncbi:MAG TPA: FecR domain-containing protein [Planctomycetota bacterium]|nr:FecR domain-containing protein [Planctomycetota bacterium]
MTSRDERIEYLVERHTRGALDADDIIEFEELCQDPQVAYDLVEALAEQREWQRAFKKSPHDAFVEVVVERSRRAGSSGKFLRSVTEAAQREIDTRDAEPRLKSRRRLLKRGRAARRSFWFPAVLAAGLAAAVLAFAYLQKHTEQPVAVSHAEAIAQIISANDGQILHESTQSSAQANAALFSGTTLVSQSSPLRFQFAGESTSVELQPNSKLILKSGGTGKRMELLQGSVSASVAPQKQPLVIATDFAEAKVLGTEFRFAHEGDSARLQVDKGRVLLSRTKDGASIEVGAGQVAVAPADVSIALSMKLPAPWEQIDIGNVRQPGSVVILDARFSMRACGTDIWEKSDGFYFVYQPLEGDGEIVARVNEIRSAGEWALAGLMIRETLTPDSVHATMMATTQLKAKLRRRVTPAGTTLSTGPSAGNVTLPKWLKLTRSGDVFKGFLSDDGRTWTLVDQDKVRMQSQTVYIGIVGLTVDNGGLSTMLLDSVTVRDARKP